MELFVSNAVVHELERDLISADGAQAAVLVQLAWHLRQRDCARALLLAGQAEALLGKDDESRRLWARILLLQAECKLLFVEFNRAEALLAQAIRVFTELQDSLGLGDAYSLQAQILTDQGFLEQSPASFDLARQAYQQAGEILRADIIEARYLVSLVFNDPQAIAAQLAQRFPEDKDYPAALAAYIATAYGLVAALTNSPSRAIQSTLRAYSAALDCGLLRLAIISANNIANAFESLEDLDLAMEWLERGLSLARSAGWPSSVGFCLMLAGDLLQQLDRRQEARTCLEEGMQLLAKQTGLRNYALGLQAFGRLELAAGHFLASLQFYTQLEAHPLSSTAPDQMMLAWSGQASALFRLGQLSAAHDKAQAALVLARKYDSVDMQVKILRVLAEMHLSPELAPPADMLESNASLHYLMQALQLLKSKTNYALSSELLAEVAKAYAASGDFAAAYRYGAQASEVYKSNHSAALERRALAMQIHHDLERARAETENHRQVALTLKETSATLETLGVIGREITASLDKNAVFATLFRHVNELLDARCFLVFMLQEDILTMAFSRENGVAVDFPPLTLDHPQSHFARVARTRKEILVHLEAEHDDPNHVLGTLDTHSLLFAPLLVGDRLLGVMSIQTPSLYAYGERESSIFLTLCAYGAIALDNAAAYAQAERAQAQADQALSHLRQTQSELIQHEKMASLGALVAGMAHELNTPIGCSVLVASTIKEQTGYFLEQVKSNTAKRRDVEEYCRNADESADLLSSCLDKAVHLISSFKKIAVDQTSDQRRAFDLRKECEDVVLMLSSQLRSSGHHLHLEVPKGLKMDSYPGPFSQVLSNLIINAMVHGLDGRTNGQIYLSCELHDAQSLRLLCRDNGQGIPSENLDRVFAPFFTTRLGQGGSGLGLHISYNIIHSVLGGSISVSSPADQGACFEVILPLVAPELREVERGWGS